MAKRNHVERISYSGGLVGMLAGSSKGRLQGRIDAMNQKGWNLHFIHQDQPNLFRLILSLVILCLTLGLWTIGYSELLVFESDER